jgi:NlpC/P60 family putative phage cell wall peptidase
MREADRQAVIAAARGWLGTPYHDQASVKGAGCDCLGLVRGVWREIVGPEPEAAPPYSRDWGEAGPREVLADAAYRWLKPIALEDARAGHVLLFRMRRQAIAKHAGILVAADRMIHAREGTGVIEEPLADYWRRRAAFAFAFPPPPAPPVAPEEPAPRARRKRTKRKA